MFDNKERAIVSTWRLKQKIFVHKSQQALILNACQEQRDSSTTGMHAIVLEKSARIFDLLQQVERMAYMCARLLNVLVSLSQY